jgi:hypothetical protein
MSRTARYDNTVFATQFPIVKRFVYHLIFYRVFSRAYTESQIQNEFWALTIDAHLLQATNLWCMVFGSDGCNATHWKHLAMSRSESLRQSFREGLVRQTGLSLPQWERYWKEMTDFRNGFAAHRELDFCDPVPNFNTALTVAHYYDEWVRRVISPDVLSEPLLSAFASGLIKATTPLAHRLLAATKADPVDAGDTTTAGQRTMDEPSPER